MLVFGIVKARRSRGVVEAACNFRGEGGCPLLPGSTCTSFRGCLHLGVPHLYDALLAVCARPDWRSAPPKAVNRLWRAYCDILNDWDRDNTLLPNLGGRSGPRSLC